MRAYKKGQTLYDLLLVELRVHQGGPLSLR